MTLAAWALLTATLLVSACSAANPPIAEPSPSDNAIVFVIERGWHTDIGFPVEEIAGPLATLERRFPGVRFLTFGFGERQFLLSKRTTFGGMLSALLPSSSALLMTALSAPPDAAFGQKNVVVLHVSREGLERIETRVWDELEKSPAGEPVLLTDGPYEGSVFYAARSTYDAFDTCNTWTATLLRAGGLPMPTAGMLFSGQVMGAARSLSARQASVRRGG
ncbi:MAG TPA: DUF2459 domain-containing protein [Acetobacteraceae bacterium]